MTMHSRDLSEMPPETAAVGGRVMREANPYRVIGDALADILADEQFAEMYEPIGREALSPSMLAMVTLFQFHEKVPDREAAEMVAVRLDWKYALHLPLDYTGFDFSVLCDFRRRILEHGKEALVFEAILDRVKALGFIKKRGKARTDSIAVLGAVRALSILETVSESLRLAVRAIEGADPAWAEETIPGSFREQYGRMRPDYRLSQEEREAALRQTGEDGYWLLDRIDASASRTCLGAEAVGVMRTVWGQRYDRVEGKVALRQGTVECTELIVTPHDPGVRAGEKRGVKWHGEKVHVTETAEAGQVNFITDVTTSGASSGDGEALAQIREGLARREVSPPELYVDSGYVSGKQMAQSQATGTVLMGPPLPDTSPNGFKIRDFEIDRAARHARCPGGQESARWSERTDRDGSKAVNIQFAASACAACPLREECTSSQGGRSLHLSEHHEALEARRAEAESEGFRQRMRARPAIEATLSELVRGYGLRQHRYRGDAKRHFENMLKAASCNLSRLVRALLAHWRRAEAARGADLAVASM
jgi:transposase